MEATPSEHEKQDSLSNALIGEENGHANGIGLPQPLPLSHADPFVSPVHAPNFNVDEFLASRAAGQTLGEITAELQLFSNKLRHELDEVVDRDFRGFVNLGVALKSEGPRIARLDWKVSQPEEKQEIRQDALWSTSSDSPRGAGGNLGLELVRTDVENVRDQLRKAEEAVRSTISRKEAVENERTNLQVLLSFTDSLSRLEGLLLAADQIEDVSEMAENGVTDGADGRASEYWEAFEEMGMDERGEEGDEEGDSDYMSSSDEELLSTEIVQRAPPSSRTDRRAQTRRRSSGIKAARRRSSLDVNDVLLSRMTDSSKPVLSLPARIARASSEHAALLFLAKQTRDIGHAEYITAHERRLARVREALEADLRSLVKTLTGFGGASLLVERKMESSPDEHVYRTQQSVEIESWHRDADDSEENRRLQQLSWLEMAFSLWSTLVQDSELKNDQDLYAAEEAVRTSLVEPWSRKYITPSSLDRTVEMPGLPVGHAPKNGQPDASNTTTSSTHEKLGNTALLPADVLGSDEAGTSTAQALIRLYNEVLTFVALNTLPATLAAETVMQTRIGTDRVTDHRASSESPQEGGECEVYVRSVWREIGSRLMDQLGGQLFFVGRPEDFRRNYKVSMAFLRAFEQLAPSARAVLKLRQDGVYLAFRKRWQLSVYFQMRFREIVNGFEPLLRASDGFLSGDVLVKQSHPLPLMPATRGAVDAFQATWSATSHIRELSHRQWRLSLQLLSRYRSWLQDELPQDVLPAHRRVIDAGRSAAAPARSSFEQQRMVHTPPNPGSSVASPTRAGTPTSHDVDNDNQLVAQCTALAADILWFDEQILLSFDTMIVPLLNDDKGARHDPMTKSLRETLESALQPLKAQILPLLAAKVTSILKLRSAEPLRLVRSVSTQYRTATQPSTPTKGSGAANALSANVEPSFFVNQFLRPVRQYLGKLDSSASRSSMMEASAVPTLSRLLPKDVREEWIGDVLEDFVVRYTASLHTMSKNFESLQRLKRVNATSTHSALSQGAEAGKGEAVNEADRMHMQMIADVDQLEREVRELRALQTNIPTDTPAWRRLKAAARGEGEDGML